MKYFTYIFRNARRNPVRSLLTIASTGICLFLMMILMSFFAISEEANASTRIFNRIVSLNANGFAGYLPIARVNEIRRLDGVVASTPFSWIGGKYQNEILPFAQFGVYPEEVFKVMSELTIPDDQLRDFRENRNACVIGRKLAADKHLKVGDSLPLKADYFPVDLNLAVRGIYDGPSNRDLRMCLAHWDYLDEALKRAPFGARRSGNAAMIFTRCNSADEMAALSKKIDDAYRNTAEPMRTQTEEAFGKLFEEMMGDMKGMIRIISVAVVFSLLCVAANSMAMSMRERTSEVAVLKAIGFNRRLVLFMVLAEAVLVAGSGGTIGTLGSKALCDAVDLSQFAAGFLPFYYIPWTIALQGLAVSLFIGLASGIVPALRAANLSVVDGLRRVI
jgi:putative ABC transport system permease protein